MNKPKIFCFFVCIVMLSLLLAGCNQYKAVASDNPDGTEFNSSETPPSVEDDETPEEVKMRPLTDQQYENIYMSGNDEEIEKLVASFTTNEHFYCNIPKDEKEYVDIAIAKTIAMDPDYAQYLYYDIDTLENFIYNPDESSDFQEYYKAITTKRCRFTQYGDGYSIDFRSLANAKELNPDVDMNYELNTILNKMMYQLIRDNNYYGEIFLEPEFISKEENKAGDPQDPNSRFYSVSLHFTPKALNNTLNIRFDVELYVEQDIDGTFLFSNLDGYTVRIYVADKWMYEAYSLDTFNVCDLSLDEYHEISFGDFSKIDRFDPDDYTSAYDNNTVDDYHGLVPGTAESTLDYYANNGLTISVGSNTVSVLDSNGETIIWYDIAKTTWYGCPKGLDLIHKQIYVGMSLMTASSADGVNFYYSDSKGTLISVWKVNANGTWTCVG